jgi:hypothetical protein
MTDCIGQLAQATKWRCLAMSKEGDRDFDDQVAQESPYLIFVPHEQQPIRQVAWQLRSFLGKGNRKDEQRFTTGVVVLPSRLREALKAVKDVMGCLGLDSKFLNLHRDATFKRPFCLLQIQEKRANVGVITRVNKRFKPLKRFLLLSEKVFQDFAFAVTRSLALGIHDEPP